MRWHDVKSFAQQAQVSATPDHLVSWVEIENEGGNLNFAECHYIGLLRPGLNFGGDKA